MQQVVRKRPQKSNWEIILHYMSLPIYPNAKKLLVFGEDDSRCLSNFLQSHIFNSLIIFLEPAINLISGIFDVQK